MESYLREIKNIPDSSAATNTLATEQELIQFTIDGLDDDYEGFITTATYFGEGGSYF